MWHQLLASFPTATTSPPAPASRLRDAEAALGGPLPGDLAALLAHTDGVVGEWGESFVWSIGLLVETNVYFRTAPDFVELYDPFDGLLFFGDNGGGDQFAFRYGSTDPAVLVWEHETDERYRIADGLAGYLRDALASNGGDWYQPVGNAFGG